jgi:hypothetical protein
MDHLEGKNRLIFQGKIIKCKKLRCINNSYSSTPTHDKRGRLSKYFAQHFTC